MTLDLSHMYFFFSQLRTLSELHTLSALLHLTQHKKIKIKIKHKRKSKMIHGIEMKARTRTKEIKEALREGRMNKICHGRVKEKKKKDVMCGVVEFAPSFLSPCLCVCVSIIFSCLFFSSCLSAYVYMSVVSVLVFLPVCLILSCLFQLV